MNMDKKNSSIDGIKSSGALTWINSDLYSFRENSETDGNQKLSESNFTVDYSKQVHDEFNVGENRLFPYSMEISTVPKGDGKRMPVADAGGSSISSKLTTPASSTLPERCFVVNLYIETKLSHIGPLPFEVHPKMSVRLLKLQVENELGIPASSQKWILKNTLGIDNEKSLFEYGVTPTSPVFLYVDSSFDRKIDVRKLSASETSSLPELSDCNNQSLDNQRDLLQEENLNEEIERNYQFLLRMENLNLVRNVVNFTCPVCFGEFESDQGVVLHECLHTFCLDCLKKLVEYAEEAQIKCPFRDDFYSCQSHLQQREIKALVPEDVYERYLQRSIVTAESLAEKSFHCKTPDCPGWCLFEDSINVFHCPVCGHYNCLNCMAMHEGLNCRQYQDKLMQQKKMDPDSEKTLHFLNKMIESGKAVKCPKCDLILMKKWGCDWLKCSVCLTEICWITKGPRWGPGGQGDTSAGCRCGVNGIKCHPSCTYCH